MSEVLATIPMAMEPARVAIAPDGSRAYVTMSELVAEGPDVDAIAVIDTTTRTVVATIPVGSMPAEVVVAPDGKTVYVPCWNGAELQGILSIIDVSTNTVTGSVVLSGRGGAPTGAAITPDGSRVYVSTQGEADVPGGNGKVSVVNTATKRVVVTIPINPFEPGVADKPATHPIGWSGTANGVAIMPDGQTAYVTDRSSKAVRVIPVDEPEDVRGAQDARSSDREE